ncbi:MAG: beta-lactamase family protein [Spirochaetia bacterium]|nr:beta-lactamase family protein [Spirochaetia bacterium]
MKNTITKKLKIFSLFTYCVFLSSIFFPSCSSVKENNISENSIQNEKYEKFCTQTDEYLLGTNFSGTILVAKGDEIVFAKPYGVCDKNLPDSQPITLNTTFEIGSVSKQITAAAVMQLVQKKKLSLDDRISKFFPEYVHGDKISVRMLLNMRSGLTDHINEADEFFPQEIFSTIHKKQIANEPFEENFVLKYFYDAPLLANPNSTYFYCNTNYYLLAKIVEIVTKQPYHEYLQKHIFEKCKMTNTNTDFQNTTAKGYDFRNRYYSLPHDFATGCGDINSTVIDLYKWNMQLAKGKIINKKSLKQMLDTEAYGFGVYVKEDKIFHSGITNVFNSYNLYSFKNQLSIIVLANKPIAQCNATFVANRLEKMFYED